MSGTGHPLGAHRSARHDGAPVNASLPHALLPAAAAAAAAAPYVLLVEDRPGDARLTQALLADAGPMPPLRWVQSLDAAVRMLDAAPGCSAVLLDLDLPDGQGLQAVHAIARHADAVPVVVLTGDDNEALGLDAVVAGAQDFLVKGSFDAALLGRCIRFSAQRKRAEQALLRRALHDELTQLPRRALFMDRLHTAMQASVRGAAALAVLFIDIDHFKQINDHCGHAVGDRLLCAVAQRVLGSVRASDTVARLGGDEFVVLLPATDSPLLALAVAHKLLAATDLLSVPDCCDGLVLPAADVVLPGISVSIGVARWQGGGESADQLIARADAAMYAAKQAGRGRVTML